MRSAAVLAPAVDVRATRGVRCLVDAALAVVLGAASACSLSPRATAPQPAPGPADVGVASWYGPGFDGRRTASGERFDADGLTAAHRSLPLGTRVRVTNLSNGRSVVVRINDRGPFVHGREIDLSRGAARALGMERGTGHVRVEVLGSTSRCGAAGGGGRRVRRRRPPSSPRRPRAPPASAARAVVD